MKKFENRTNGNYHIHGKDYPSVTTILRVIAKPALFYYYAQMAHQATKDLPSASFEDVWSEINKRQSTTKERGSDVHNLVEGYFKHKTLEGFDETNPYHQAFVHFLFDHDHTTTPLHSERQVWSDTFGYAGTMDAVLRMGRKTFIVDFKTGRRLYPIELSLQLTGYLQAAYELGLIDEVFESIGMRGVCLKDNATYEMKELEYSMDAFLSVFNLYKHVQKYEHPRS